MSNVIQFPTHSRSQPVANVDEPAAQADLRPRSEPVALLPGVALALMQQALGFYARQGYDGGAKARQAIAAMQRELIDPPPSQA